MNESLTHVLIVEDDPRLAGLLRDYLGAAGYRTSWLADGATVVQWVRDFHPALVLLDLLLPGKDGLTICRELRAFTAVPIVITTARVEEIDRLLGLDLGADDYLCKPYSLREVVARARAVLRRGTVPAVNATPSPLRLDADRFEAYLNGKRLTLTPVEFRLLSALNAAVGRVCPRQQLMPALYTDCRVVSDRTIDSHIKNLRRKLAEAWPECDPVHSIYGVGYKLSFDADDDAGNNEPPGTIDSS